MIDLLVILAFQVFPIVSIWAVVRYGPWRSRWWRREHPLGFALAVGGVCFLAGFVGPMLLGGGNQGPLLGIFITGPLGVVVGLIWGFLRALRRNTTR